MRISSSLILAAVLAAAAPAQAGVDAVVVPQKVEISGEPLGALAAKLNFDVNAVGEEPDDAPDQQYGPAELLLVNFGREFESYREILAALSARRLVPGTYRDLLAYAAAGNKDKTHPRRIIALGSQLALPSGTPSWQACGVNESRQSFVGYVVEGEGWPAEFLYLAKRIPPKPKRAITAGQWKEIRKISSAVADAIAARRQHGDDPDKFFRPIDTGLSYRDIAIAAYCSPKSADDIDAADERCTAGVLGKALFESNRLNGGSDPPVCFMEACPRRKVKVVLTPKGLGIISAPIRAGYGYSGRLLR